MNSSLPQLREIDPAFMDALRGEDVLGVVVRSHIHVEAHINRYLDIVVTSPQFLPRMNLTYRKKVELACVLGLDSTYMDALIILGEIRNSFSHKLDAQLTDQLVGNLYQKLPPKCKLVFEETFTRVKSQLGPEGPFGNAELAPKEKFILITLTLERLLVSILFLVESSGPTKIPAIKL
jgi:hypothetical protein